MVRKRQKSRLPQSIQEESIRQLVAGTTARTAADLVSVNRHIATVYFHKLRKAIARQVVTGTPFLSGEIEMDESYFGGVRKGKQTGGDVSEFRHHRRINHSEGFVEGITNHSNGIEKFWN